MTGEDMFSLRDQLQDLNRSGLIILREAEDEFNPVTVDRILNRGFSAIRTDHDQTAAADQFRRQCDSHFTGEPDRFAVGFKC